jgi:hypothetical protein
MQEDDFPKTNLAPARAAGSIYQNLIRLGFHADEIRQLFQRIPFSRVLWMYYQFYFFQQCVKKI